MKVAVGLDGKNVLGEGRANLLGIIERTGSLRKAAWEMGMSYRYAWGMIKRMEEQLGEKLVASERGGARGGRTLLTDAARKLLEDYERTREGALRGIDRELLKVEVVLVLKDAEGRCAVKGGMLPKGVLGPSASPEGVLKGLLSELKVSQKGLDGPKTFMDGEVLHLVYSSGTSKKVEGSMSVGELSEKDRSLIRLFSPA